MHDADMLECQNPGMLECWNAANMLEWVYVREINRTLTAHPWQQLSQINQYKQDNVGVKNNNSDTSTEKHIT